MRKLLTAHEKEERKAQRIKRIEERAERLPGAHFSPRQIQIILEEGDSHWVKVRTKDLAHFKPSRIGGGNGWVEASLPLHDISELAQLVQALSARLNERIREVNEDIRSIRVLKLEECAPSAETAKPENTPASA